MKNSETIYNIYIPLDVEYTKENPDVWCNPNGILVDNNLTGEEVYLNGYTDERYNIVPMGSQLEYSSHWNNVSTK
tara:strand:- start:786 stop:1010 length:225 start_codon:yes stop_codon:yes gene_type:complete